MKKLLKILGYGLMVVLIIIVGLLTYVKTLLPNVGSAPELKVEITTEKIERGKYLTNNVMLCMDCHSTRDWSLFSAPMITGTEGKGGETFDQKLGFPGKYIAPNITPFHLKNWTDGEIFRAVIKAQEEERQVISSNIHDDLGALLTSARISIDNILTDANPEQINQIKHLADVVSQASKSAKTASNALTPNTVSKYGLKGAIMDLPTIFRYANVTIDVSYDIQKEIDSFIQISIYRIIYEIVNNSVKYAKASTISVHVIEDGRNRIQIEAADNGIGFNLEDVLETSNGIKNIKNRVNLLNGKISLESTKNNGCKYIISI